MPINIVDLSSVDIVKFSELSVTFDNNDLTDNFLIAIESISGDTGNLRIGDLKSFVFENSELTGTPTAPTVLLKQIKTTLIQSFIYRVQLMRF